MKEQTQKRLIKIIYGFIILTIFLTFCFFGNFQIFRDFITKIENNSFDLRQSVISKHKKIDNDIVILALDDATYEYIMDKYGYWPISRKVWANVVNNIEKQNPKSVIFDMLFIKPNLTDIDSDNIFIETVKKHPNIYLSMSFDNYDDVIRQSSELKEDLMLKVVDGGLYDNQYITFKNSRRVMKNLEDITNNIGAINVTRDTDGIIRDATPVFRYKDLYYPNLTLKVAMDLLDKKALIIKNNTIIIDKKHKIPLDETQRAVLNWYGKAYSYNHIPLWQTLEAIKNNDTKFFEQFKNKNIYIGTTAMSMGDIKSTPVEYNMSGVEFNCTFLNNILKNDFIKKTPPIFDFLISIILMVIIGYYVLKTDDVIKTISFSILAMMFYGALSIILMLLFNLWVPVVLPFVSCVIIFIIIYCQKYLLKSKDYEQTYQLAVTDGLTNLYNHRYFQEQMIINVNNFKRYNIPFSLILIDIDFFKKFNDKYGHQSGDIVLKQVANILKKNSRTSDIVCRYGGEEMAIILTNTVKKDAIITANKICNAVSSYKFILADSKKVNVTISIGVSSVEKDGKTPQDIIEYADKCLYRAKEQGRNQVVSEV